MTILKALQSTGAEITISQALETHVESIIEDARFGDPVARSSCAYAVRWHEHLLTTVFRLQMDDYDIENAAEIREWEAYKELCRLG